jgi:hypothetical protein
MEAWYPEIEVMRASVCVMKRDVKLNIVGD